MRNLRDNTVKTQRGILSMLLASKINAVKKIIWMLPLIFLQSCDTLFEYHPYDGKVAGETNINSKNIKRIEKICAGKTIIRFIMTGDTQRWYDETEKFVAAVNKRDDIDFVIHGGDISDFGLTNEFMWQRDILNGLKIPYVVLLGNHDCLGTGEYVFREIFGKENFSFTAGDVKFLCLNTNALEYDYSHPVPDFGFLEDELNANMPDYLKTVVAMHAPPYSEQFNNNVAEMFQQNVKRFPELQFCIYAHVHNLNAEDIFKDGVMYYSSASIEKRNFLIFTITPDGYTYEKVDF